MAEHKKHEKLDENKDPLHGSGTMTTQEIVKRSIERMEPGADWENIYAHLYHAIKSNKFRAIRHGNTILFFHVKSPEAAQAHLFSADSQDKFLEISIFKNEYHPFQ